MEENSDLEDHFQNNNRLGLIKRNEAKKLTCPVDTVNDDQGLNPSLILGTLHYNLLLLGFVKD